MNEGQVDLLAAGRSFCRRNPGPKNGSGQEVRSKQHTGNLRPAEQIIGRPNALQTACWGAAAASIRPGAPCKAASPPLQALGL